MPTHEDTADVAWVDNPGHSLLSRYQDESFEKTGKWAAFRAIDWVDDHRHNQKASEQPIANGSAGTDASVESEFAKLARSWKRNTAHMSLVARKVSDPSYQSIIAMGERVVPLILRDLEREPQHWFAALRALTGKNPTASCRPGDVKCMVESWLQWGRSEKLI